MSVVGRRLWLHMQATTPPFNRRSLSNALKKSGIYPTSPQSISNYLYRDHPPVGFVNAMVDMLHLSEEDEQELHWLYFRGNSESADDWRERRRYDPLPDKPGHTEENASKLEAKKRELDERDGISTERDSQSGDRV